MDSKVSDLSGDIINGSIKIVVEKVKVEGNGVILLTGPSSCGKGEIAKSLCKFLSLTKERHLSMGEILRKTVNKAKHDKEFRNILSENYFISAYVSIFDKNNNKGEIVDKAESYKNELIGFSRKKDNFVSQLDWLEFCVAKGLLVPDEWTDKIIDALFENSPELQEGILILDGYPRTKAAAEYLLKAFKRLHIPIIKVIHLSITKEQMKIRAYGRGRYDDTEDSLDRRYHFYIEKVQPTIDYLKQSLGSSRVALIDAHQPVFEEDGSINVDKSIRKVTLNVMQALGLPGFLLDLDC